MKKTWLSCLLCALCVFVVNPLPQAIFMVSPWLLFVRFGAGSEIIDVRFGTGIFLVIGSEDLAGESLLEGLFPAFRSEFGRTAPGRLGVGTEILAGTIASRCLSRARISEIWAGTPHGSSHGPRRSGRRPESAWRSRTGITGTGLVHSEGPAFEWLVVELADGFLGLLLIRKLNESESALLAGLAIKRDRHVREISYRREVRSDLAFGSVIGKIPYKETDRHCYLRDLTGPVWGGMLK